MKTIKQIADELGVTKQAVRKRLTVLPPTSVVTSENGTILIDISGEAVLRTLIMAKPQTEPPTKPQTKPPTFNADEVLELQHKIEKLELEKELNDKHAMEKLEILNRELRRKDEIISDQLQTLRELTQSIQAAQALHAGTIQKQLSAAADPEQPAAADPERELEIDVQPKKQGMFRRILSAIKEQ